MTPIYIIQILSYILAGFYSVKWLAECSELSKTDISPNDLLHYPTSSMIKEVSDLETSIFPDDDGQISSQAYVVEDILKADLLINDSISEDISSNDSDDEKSNSKRDVFDGKWTHANKMQILQLHNLLRGNVTPPAGNMAYMEWDTELERLAQKRADNCSHHYVEDLNGYTETVGQNIHIATDQLDTGLYAWYEEYHNYDWRTKLCIPNKKCGHYVQMAWAESSKLGCAMAKCPMNYYIVCNYSPAAVHGVQIYRVAEPCSQCSDKNVLCLKNLCVTPKQCKNKPFNCQDAECNLKCHNCGRLDKETCTCECTDGWETRDCSQLCKDKDKKCGVSPGGYSRSVCSKYKAVANTYCRKMCGMCHEMPETSNNTCCGRICEEEGYVLDPSGKSCECVVLCPGPICDCPSFEIRNDMSIVYSESNKGDIIATFTCHNNTKLVGSNTSECQLGGKWSSSLPYCEDEKEAILSLAAIGGGAENLKTFPCIIIWMVILKLIELYLLNAPIPSSSRPAD